MIQAIFIPGNGGGSPKDAWFPYLQSELEKMSIKVINVQFPDAILARREFWLPFIKERGANESTILIGHSSGALAAMRYAEQNKILGSVLVGASYTDLGEDSEKQSHYFDEPWQWDKIKENQKWIIQFASTDDPFIPIAEPRYIHENLNTDYHEYTNRGHFTSKIFPEILEAVSQKNINYSVT